MSDALINLRKNMGTHATLPKLAGNLLNGKNRALLEVLYDAPICLYVCTKSSLKHLSLSAVIEKEIL
jgi:hypothetical protein